MTRVPKLTSQKPLSKCILYRNRRSRKCVSFKVNALYTNSLVRRVFWQRRGSGDTGRCRFRLEACEQAVVCAKISGHLCPHPTQEPTVGRVPCQPPVPTPKPSKPQEKREKNKSTHKETKRWREHISGHFRGANSPTGNRNSMGHLLEVLSPARGLWGRDFPCHKKEHSSVPPSCPIIHQLLGAWCLYRSRTGFDCCWCVVAMLLASFPASFLTAGS